MPPVKSFDLLLDEVIETNIDKWIEDNHPEPVEQLDLFEDE